MLNKFRRTRRATRARTDVVRHRSRQLATVTADRLRWLLTGIGQQRDQLITTVGERGRVLGRAASDGGQRLLAAATATRRSKALVATATALVFLTGGAMASFAAVASDEPAPVEVAGPAGGDAVADREQDVERADRGERDEVEQPDPPAETAEQSAPKASAPDESPAPAPSPAESKPAAKPKPEPKPEPKKTEAPPPAWSHPMPGASTTSCFGFRWGAMHAGVDLALPQGTPIRAVGAGTVTQAGWAFGGYGISVVIDHGDGHYTHYAHASQTKVSPGQKVKPGQIIALEGSTGDSTGPHLHFEVHKGMWNQVEPTAWLNNRGVKIGGC